MLQKSLMNSRFVILIAIIGSFFASLTTLIFGGIRTVTIILEIFNEKLGSLAVKAITIEFIEIIDLFLVGAIFYIVALGLYELFINDRLELMPWLAIHNLDDLKEILISGIVVVMIVYFLGVLVSWDKETDLMQIGLPIALIIASLSLFHYVKEKKHQN